MVSYETPVLLGNVSVVATNNRGMTPEELTDLAVDKIIYVGQQSHPVIREQAEAFKRHIHSVVLAYMKQAVASHNTTIANRLKEAGHPELVAILND
jgi:hypothetical protein